LIIITWFCFGNGKGLLAASVSDDVQVSQTVYEEEVVVPPTPPPSGTSPGQIIIDRIPPQIKNIQIDVTANSAIISYETDELAKGAFTWGKTSDYELGTTIEAYFLMRHVVEIRDLIPQTFYHFQISVHDSYGNQANTPDMQFKTLAQPDKTAPLNVSNLEAIPYYDRIELSWLNPKDDFAGVEIWRSDVFYPQDRQDGVLVYRGDAEKYIDKDVVQGKEYYYTVFAYDEQNNYSSGAITSARVPMPGEMEGVPGEIEIEVPPVVPGEVPTTPEITLLIEDFGLTLDDIIFTVKGVRAPVIDGQLKLKPNEPLNIAINYDKLPAILKTIAFTLKSGTKSFSFLLRVNEAKTAYEATVAVPEASGLYPFIVNLLGFRDQRHQQLTGILIVKEVVQALCSLPEPSPFLLMIKKIGVRWDRVLIALLLLLFGYLFYRFYRFRKKRLVAEKIYY